MKSMYANLDGDEVLFEASREYAAQNAIHFKFTTQTARDEHLDVVAAIFQDGARWAVQNCNPEVPPPHRPRRGILT